MPQNIINLLDNLDIYLLKEIYERETTGTRILAIDYFFKGVEEKNLWRKIQPKDMLVNFRLKKMANLGLIIMERRKSEIGRLRREYSLNLKNVKITRHKFPDKYSKAIILRIKDKWCIFEVD